METAHGLIGFAVLIILAILAWRKPAPIYRHSQSDYGDGGSGSSESDHAPVNSGGGDSGGDGGGGGDGS